MDHRKKQDRNVLQFHEMELDDRILKAIAKLGWILPTPIQEKAIPLLLEGKDMLMRARTGSGKTGAFVIPIVQKILISKVMSEESDIKALILAPSKELCNQIHSNVLELTRKCSRHIRCVDISSPVDLSVQTPLLLDKPDILVATPSRVLLHLKAKILDLKNSLEVLVIDEADLVFSFGHEKDITDVLRYFPKVYQSVLASATLSEEVISLKKLILREPVILKLEEPDVAPLSQLTHYYLNAEEEEKAVILYTQLKLSLIRGKSIVFVNTVDRCYKLKLFLEQFGIPTCVLNSELPSASRCHAIKQFNEDVYNTLIASDEQALEETYNKNKGTNQSGKRRQDKESGVARGIDFQFVSNIINFDFPKDISSYIHRAGRTARGTNKGTVLSFVSIREIPLMHQVSEYLKERLKVDADVFTKYKFTLQEVEGFRYRAKDAWRAVTRVAVREARLKEIKYEIINSKKLKRYFEENPRDLKTLRHDKALHTVKLQDHLKDVPDYIVPPSLKKVLPMNNKKISKSAQKLKFKTRNNVAFKKYVMKKQNPLISMQFSGFEDATNDDK